MSDEQGGPQSAPPGEDRPRRGRPWLGLAPRDRRFYAAVLLLLLLGQAVRGVWLLLDPEVRVTARFWSRWTTTSAPGYQFVAFGDTDPWERPYLRASNPDLWHLQIETAWSSGPNGRDEGGAGDDILVLPQHHPRYFAYTLLTPLTAALAALAVIAWELTRYLRRPRWPLRIELAAAAVAALPVGALAIGLLLLPLWRGWLPAPLRADLEARLLVPLEVAVGAWALVASYGLLLWLRLRREAEPAG